MEDLKQIYFLFVRSQLEQSAVVWHSSLSEDNKADLERVQKSVLKIIQGEKYQSYQRARVDLGIESLENSREHLCLRFALKCSKNEKTQQMFPINEKQHEMKTSATCKYWKISEDSSHIHTKSIEQPRKLIPVKSSEGN